ncbi:hypothetical protein M2318_004653 [Metapseudomonas resinovorans]
MPREILLIADAMFPETSLPDSAFAFAPSTGRERFAWWHCAGKAALYLAPAQSVIRIARRQGAERMEVIRKDDNGVDAPGMARHAKAKAGAEQVDAFGEQMAVTVGQVEGEEPGCAWGAVAAVVGYWGLPCLGIDGFRKLYPSYESWPDRLRRMA